MLEGADMKKRFNDRLLATLGLVLMVSAPSVMSQTRPPIADSTGIHTGVVATLVIPAAGGGARDRATLPPVNGDTGVPPGYREIVVPMGNRYLGEAQAGEAVAAYYFALGYPAVISMMQGATNGAAVCAGYSGSGEVLVYPGFVDPAAEAGQSNTTPPDYTVCEPQGTRSTLQKIVGAQQLTLTDAQLASNVIAPAVGVSTQAATAVCQVRGYTNYVVGTVTATQAYDCGYRITRWNGTAFYNDDACYNPLMHGLTCWR